VLKTNKRTSQLTGNQLIQIVTSRGHSDERCTRLVSRRGGLPKALVVGAGALQLSWWHYRK
jgi:hypothetical protein